MRICRKSLAMLMGLLVLFTALPAFADSVTEALTLSLVSAQEFENNHDARIQLSAKNNTAASETADFILGLYETESNKMVSYTYVEDTVAGGESKQWGAGMAIPAAGNYYIKAFAWSDFASAKLVSNILRLDMAGQPSGDLQTKIKNAVSKTGAYLTKNVAAPEVGTVGGEWTVLGLARSGYPVPQDYYEAYYAKAARKVKAEAEKASGVWSNKVTDVQRVSLALTAIGRNPQEVDGVNLLDYSWNKAEHFPGLNAPGNTLGGRQGANELIYALLATQAHDSFQAPPQSSMDTDAMITALLTYQKDGGFALDQNGGLNVDITAMAVQALAKSYDKPAVKTAVDASLDKLSSLQSSDGQIEITDGGKTIKSVETVCQTIVALTELGIDPASDSRFVKNGTSIVDALFAFAGSDGSFVHTMGETEASQMATEQAMYALAALSRFYQGDSSLYDMNDVGPIENPVGKVKMSIEKRMIGKGDVLALADVDLYAGDTAFTVLKRTAAKNQLELSFSYNEPYNSYYVSSVAGDGEFDYGASSGWLYEVNGLFPDKGLNQYTLADKDVMRLRYTVSGDMAELQAPLAEYLRKLIRDTEQQLRTGSYTEETKAEVNAALASARTVADDPQYNSTDADKELAVSAQIGKINDAVAGLKADPDQPPAEPTVPEDFENDLWLQYDFREMTVGGEDQVINPRRVPEAITNNISNDVDLPNFHFDIVEGDSVTVTPVASAKHGGRDTSAAVSAVKPGVTVVRVTYDAFEHSSGKSFPACSEVNAAYVVYSVTGPDGGITIDPGAELNPIRSYDTFYFAEGSSVDFSFKPVITGADSVTVTCNGKTAVANGDGSYTAPLENRANVIGITAENASGSKCYYKVIDARKIEINIVNMTDQGAAPKAGDTINVSFKGITPPVYKLATIYNPALGSSSFVEYTNDAVGTVKGKSGQYDLATNNDFDVVFNEAGSYTFSGGRIFTKWYGDPLGADKDKIGQGDPNLNAGTLEGYFSQMPDFTIAVSEGGSAELPADAYAAVTIEVKNGVKIFDHAALTEAKGYRKDIIIDQLFKGNSELSYVDGGYSDVFKSITYRGETYTKENGAGSWEYYLNGEKLDKYNYISFVNLEKGDNILIRFVPAGQE